MQQTAKQLRRSAGGSACSSAEPSGRSAERTRQLRHDGHICGVALLVGQPHALDLQHRHVGWLQQACTGGQEGEGRPAGGQAVWLKEAGSPRFATPNWALAQACSNTVRPQAAAATQPRASDPVPPAHPHLAAEARIPRRVKRAVPRAAGLEHVVNLRCTQAAAVCERAGAAGSGVDYHRLLLLLLLGRHCWQDHFTGLRLCLAASQAARVWKRDASLCMVLVDEQPKLQGHWEASSGHVSLPCARLRRLAGKQAQQGGRGNRGATCQGAGAPLFKQQVGTAPWRIHPWLTAQHSMTMPVSATCRLFCRAAAFLLSWRSIIA